MPKKKSILLILILLAAITLSSMYWLYTRSQGNYAGKPTNITVSLKWLHQAQFAGLYTADQMNYYQDNGLVVNLVPFDYEHLPIDEVLAGNSDFGVAGADEIIIARVNGQPVKALAVIYQENPVVAYTLEENNITSLRDFVGKRLGMENSQQVKTIIRAMLSANGVNSTTDLTEVPIGFDATSLIGGEVDIATGYIVNEPIQAENAGYDVITFLPSDYGITSYADVLFTTEAMIKDNPDLVKRFVAATLQGWEYAAKNQDEAVEHTLMYNDSNNSALNKKHQTKLLANSVGLIKPKRNFKIGSMNFVNWNRTQELLYNHNVIEERIDISNAYTTQFINE